MNHSNTSTTPNLPKDVSVEDIILVIAALILSASIITVNLITIIIIKKTHHLQTISNIYIVSLAVADLVVGLGLLPLSVFYVPAIRRNYFDRDVNLCVFIFGIDLGMAVVSTLHMTLIATDRYLYIVWPYAYQKYVHRKGVYAILGCTWIFGLCYALLPQLIHQEAALVSKCDITTILPIGYLFYSNASIYVLCSLVDVAMYSQILLAANRQRRVIRSSSKSVDGYNTDGSLSDTATDATQYHIATICFNNRLRTAPNQLFYLLNIERSQQEAIMHNERNKPSNSSTELSQENNAPTEPNQEHNAPTEPNQEHKAQKRASRTSIPSARIKNRSSRLKSVKFFMIVFGVYFLCLTPTVACMGIDYYLPIPRIIYNLFNLLALLNSGMNFFIFFVLNSRFRTSVLKLCRCRKRNGQLNSNGMPFFDS